VWKGEAVTWYLLCEGARSVIEAIPGGHVADEYFKAIALAL
jgi:hypothetical protein